MPFMRCGGMVGIEGALGINSAAARRATACSSVLALILAFMVALPAACLATDLQDYERADKIRALDPMSIGGQVRPVFLPDGVRFYFRSYGRDEQPGTYTLVDPRNGVKRTLFNEKALASALSEASGSTIDPLHLPRWSLSNDERRIDLDLPTGRFSCDLPALQCRKAGKEADSLLRHETAPGWAVRSPDGRWDAFIWNHDVYIRPAVLSQTGADIGNLPEPPSTGKAAFGAALEASQVPFVPTGQRADCDFPVPPGPVDTALPKYQPPPSGSIALTHDGEPLWSYGPRWKLGDEVATLDADRYRPTHGTFAWSPDSKRLLTRREDIRGMRIYPLYSSTSIKPVDHSYYYAAPGDRAIPQFDYYVLDISARTNTRLDIPPTSVLLPAGAEWSADSSQLYVLSSDRGPKEVRLSLAEASTGRARPIIRETSPTFVEMSNGGRDSIVHVGNNGKDIIWFSERDGWGHLFRYNKDGTLKNQIDKGSYSIADLVKVDDAAKQVYFTAWGKAPGLLYYRHLFRINFDGSGLIALTPEDGDHFIQAIPGENIFLDTMSTIQTPPVTILRRSDGSRITELSRGSDKELRQIGWHPAEVFTVKARDGITDLYGVMYKPKNFDPAKHYPLVTTIYPGPFQGSVGAEWAFQGPDHFFIQDEGPSQVTHNEGMGQSLAELGFIVIKLDALGSAHRSKAFQDFFYGHDIDNGLPDQVAAIQQLARRYPWIDRDRVGIFGHSGGGYAAAAGMLLYPDMFKVGVSESGNHDIRAYGWYWGEQYQGLLNSSEAAASYAAQANLTYAGNLKGHLLLMHGDMDCNNPPAETLGLVNALIKHRRPFDFLLIPDIGHQLPEYAMRKAWDYFVRNLRGEEPASSH